MKTQCSQKKDLDGLVVGGLVPYHMDFFTGLFMTWQMAFPRANDPERGRIKVEAIISF